MVYHGSTERGVIAGEAGEHAFLPFGFLFLGRVPEKCFSLFFSLSLSPSPPYRVFGETILFFFHKSCGGCTIPRVILPVQQL